VIVTDIGSIPEVVEHGKTGLIIRPRDSSSLADAILQMLKDESMRQNMGNEAYKKMESELSWKVIAKKTVDVYAKVCRNNI